ncbi:MAG: 4-alpha-glucanotransferase [bacterium]
MTKSSRKAGLILHPTALPGKWGIGDLGENIFKFIDMMAEAGISIWQILPLTPTGSDGCPYNSCSAFAGNELLIDIASLQKEGFLPQDIEIPDFNDHRVEFDKVIDFKEKLVTDAAQNFFKQKIKSEEFELFKKENAYWIDDYVLFKTLKDVFHGKSWQSWGKELRGKNKQALKKIADNHKEEIFRHQFGQWIFFKQWSKVKFYANSKNIEVMGDIPIFLSYDSSDVWANQHIFKMVDGNLLEVSGVPPDYFSENGQLWGNPLYDWDELKKNDFKWWVDRFAHNMKMYDSIRLDHFRGFSESWSVPSSEKTAKNGVWKKTPGRELFTTVIKKLKSFPVIAEDLGNIDEKVVELRDEFGFTGMKVLQFAFYDGTNHEFLPHNFKHTNSAIYTGTHDNDTMTGWYWSQSEETKRYVNHYIGSNGDDIHWKMIRLALSSIADFAFFPLQDVLGWGSDCRFNVPGTVGPHNWSWRFREGDFNQAHIHKLRGILLAFNRIQK